MNLIDLKDALLIGVFLGAVISVACFPISNKIIDKIKGLVKIVYKIS